MKTAMQELIDWSYENDKPDCTIEAYDVIKKAKDLLEKEKEQIIAARNSKEIEAIEAWDFATDIMSKGVSKKPNNLGRSAEDYYNQTYNQNK